jgi:flagellar protein FlaJ
LFFDLPVVISLIITLSVPLTFGGYVYYKNQKRIDNMYLDLPDYLRQLSALIKVGYGLESALNELSKTMNNSLNDEIKRALLETSFGRPFDEALMDIAEKNDSESMKHTFQIMIYSKESGGNLVDVLEDIADDLDDSIILKKERKANVMMSVMFLLISSTIATPFALGMIGLYSDFIGQLGRSNPLESVIPVASMGYVLIQSILVSLLIGIVLYSNAKKGIKYVVLLVPTSLFVYYVSQLLFKEILGV